MNMETYNAIRPVRRTLWDCLWAFYWVHREEVHTSAALFVLGGALTAAALAIVL